MHGIPPNDFPKDKAAEFFSLRSRLEHIIGEERVVLEHRFTEIDKRMRNWPRTLQNDPFHAASLELARHLSQATSHEVIVGFNEFCAPDLDQALEQAVVRGANKVIVITTMMTRGGGHSEINITDAISRIQNWHPDIPIINAWPFEISEVAQFLANQISHFI